MFRTLIVLRSPHQPNEFHFLFNRKLLRRKVENRLGGSSGASAVRAHRFFASVDWRMVVEKRYPPPHVPDLANKDFADVSQFDPRFTSKPARESACSPPPPESIGKMDLMFADFAYSSPEVTEDGSSTPDSGVEASSSSSSTSSDSDSLQINIHDLQIRQRGE